ncbi:MAG: dienelactone hydrolase family protein [Planctomycetota bacterium]
MSIIERATALPACLTLCLAVTTFHSGIAAAQDAAEPLSFTIERSAAHSGFDGNKCWVHARAGAIPAGVAGNDSETPLVVMTMQKLLLSGSDVFYALNETRSENLGESWTEPIEHQSFARQTVKAPITETEKLPTGAHIAPHLLQPGDETTVCDFAPKWHAASQRLLGLGHTVWYRNNRVMHVRPRGIAWAVYNARVKQWSPWKTVDLPDVPEFQCAGSGSVQRVDLLGGDVLIPFYFKEPKAKKYSVTVCRCRFDGRSLDYIEHGNSLTIPVKRGLYEPSLTHFNGRFYLTLRNDDHGYVSVSDDGLTFEEPRRWTFDDGSVLGNYNTQQHWVTHSDGLFLIYTRRGANNDHVFRHRAPLFIARVDPENLHVIRDTEQVLVPERGARLGNFGVTEVSPNETWVTVTEWMQPKGVEKHGSDNSVFVAKLKWNRPNASFDAPVAPQHKTTAMTRWESIKPYFEPPVKWQNTFGKYSSPLKFTDGSTVRSADDWQRRRKEIFTEWTERLGKWPPLITDPKVEVLGTERRENFTQHRVRFLWTPKEKTTGYLLVPDGDGPHPGVVSVFYEPETAIGLGGSPNRDFAVQLARRGFVALSIGTTEASQARTYALYHPSIEDAQVEPLSMLGCAAANAWHVLASRPEVDSKRIGLVGHSFGGKWTMFGACLFEKFACAVWSDPGSVFDNTRPSINYWEPWYLGYHPKPWRKRGLITDENPARGLYPRLMAEQRDLHELHALMAPRPFLVSGGSEDPPSHWEALNHSIAVNQILGYENRVAMTNRPDHSPNDDSNEVIYRFFEHFLIDAEAD